MALRMILWELACDIGTGTLERRVASLLIDNIIITSQAREDPSMVFMAIEKVPTKRHCHVCLATCEILNHHLVWAHSVNDTSTYCRLQLVVRSYVTIHVRRDILWGGAHVLHRTD